ncbi:hypothetical protein [Actinomadura nitritigenes]|uniref:hypothetical protein n=1 Tax=Actinomadura nitritigenes TaxID=134602 RepID=UPI003D8AAB13
MMDALSFLQDLTGYAQAQAQPSSANRPIKLATIDPAYNPAGYRTGTLPKVTFDGESTLSGKLYPVLGTYWPKPGDRVALAPVGTTYMIIGPLAPAFPAAPVIISTETDQTTTSTTFINGGLGTTFVPPPSGLVYVTVSGAVECEAPSTAFLGWEIRLTNASGAVVVAADDRRAVGVQEDKFAQASYRCPVSGLTPGTTYFIRAMLRTTNAAQTASAFWRELLVEPGGM